ncbi:MAG: hypothetical protein KFB93_08955 [Simkaniaceae bacterium]|nr:MAG: hypothetical protein KFB93_08955 [Simkaniaceae bacterium]
MEAGGSVFRGRYDRLFEEVNRVSHEGSIHERADLHRSAIALFTEVAMSGEDCFLTQDCGRLLNRFVFPVAMPDQIDRPEAVRTIYGVGSQYSDGSSSSCTSCAQSFLRNVLPLGIAWDLTTEQVTSFIDMGKGLYFALLKQAEAYRSQFDEELGPDYILHQAFSVHDICGQYGLHLIKDHRERFLDIDLRDGSLVPFFMGQLAQLEGLLSPEKISIGATIHCQEKTYALAILDTPRGREFVFFDSHGNAEVNGRNPNAYVKYTFSKEAMAEILAQVMPFHPVGEFEQGQVHQSHREGLLGEQNPLEVIARMNRENNPFILYQMDVAERGFLAMVDPSLPRIEEEPFVPGETVTNHQRRMSHSQGSGSPRPADFDGEAKKTSYVSKMIFVAIVAILIAFRNRLISIVSSYTGKDGQKMLPPLPTSRSVRVE